MTGGTFSLTGGFWSLIAVEPAAGVPNLAIQYVKPASVVVSWPDTGSYNLQTNDIINASATLTGGGTLVLTNADTNPLQAGDAFKLFNAGIYAGNFSAIALPAVPSGLYCQTNTLRIDGTVRIAIEPSPAIITATLSGSKLMLAGTGGITNGTYYVLTSTNIAAPLSRWTRLLTNQFDANANFNFTNTLSPNAPQSFYLLQEP